MSNYLIFHETDYANQPIIWFSFNNYFNPPSPIIIVLGQKNKHDFYVFLIKNLMNFMKLVNKSGQNLHSVMLVSNKWIYGSFLFEIYDHKLSVIAH